ncbi:unnamed protein product [Cuscuta epithymum]|uniref:SnoaL-like domain-containing protein n=1 Tax=Cuscuta epithymum TaxID=186058 RepID=A0AAV0F4W1_9ASTE|nr:unnamed protein product [Cuscuta epithymum]
MVPMEVSKFSAFSLPRRISRINLFYQGSNVDVRSHGNHPNSVSRIQAVYFLPSRYQKQCSRNFPRRLTNGPIDLPSHKILGPNPLVMQCRLKREDTEEGTLSGDSILLNEQSMEQELQLAIKEENYPHAAKIRDDLRLLHEDSKASVLAANARFYNSFRTGDLATMQSLWSKGENVCVVHPGVSGICGYDLVMGSWEFVWADYDFPLEIEIRDVEVHVKGGLGYVTCIEMVKTKGSSWGKQFATNVFEKIDGHWFICIHHASYIDL